MKPRCYAEKNGNRWQAVCIDYCLAAQSDTYSEVKQKLQGMVNEYLHDALVGKDRGHAHYLLQRKAPLKFRIKYHLYKIMAYPYIF